MANKKSGEICRFRDLSNNEFFFLTLGGDYMGPHKKINDREAQVLFPIKDIDIFFKISPKHKVQYCEKEIPPWL